jgi:hypothetical protein
MKQQGKQGAILSGPNMYEDKHGNLIYYQKKSNTAYRISPDKISQFKRLQMRWLLTAIAFILFYIVFNLNLWLSLGLAIVLGIGMEWQFRRFLKQLPKSAGFVKTEKIRPIDQMIDTPVSGLALRMGLYWILAALLIADSFVSTVVSQNTALQAACWILASLAIWMGWKYFSLILNKRKKAI